MTTTHARFPLTLSQADIYFDQLHHPASPLYNVGGFIRFGRVDAARMAEAHRRLVLGHDAFGIRILSDGGEPVQILSAERSTGLPLTDFSCAIDPAATARQWLADLFETPVPFENAELFRAALLKIGAAEYWYVGFAHHLAMDGWGFANWARQLGKYYSDGALEAADPLAWPAVAAADQDYVNGERCASDRAHWQACLAGVPERLLSPLPGAAADTSARHVLTLSASQSDAVDAMAHRLGVGRAPVFAGLLSAYLYGCCDRSDFVLGMPVHNRPAHAYKQMIGVFTSISPVRVQADPQASFGALVGALSERLRRDLRHQRYPLGHIVRDLGLQGGSRALYDIGFNYLKLDSKLAIDGVPATLVYLSHNHEPTPLMATIWEYGDQAESEIQLDYNLGYFSAADIALAAERLSHMLDMLPAMADAPLGTIEVMPPEERACLLDRFNPASAPPPAQCIHQLFEEQARRAPATVAVVCEGEALSYGALNARANRIAHRLRAEGVGPDTLVGLCVERSADMVAGMLGILKAGGAYVPLDPAYPRARLEFMVRDSNAPVVLTQARLLDTLPLGGALALCVDRDDDFAGRSEADPDAAAVGVTPAHLAYLIYTSGSTGVPKGVMIEHRNTVALLDWAHAHFSAAELRAVLASTSLNFDLSVFEVFVPLSFGHRCVVVRDALALLEEDCDVSLVNTVPSAMKMLLERGRVPRSAEVINLAGEPLPQKLLNGLFAGTGCRKVWNLYGPSEDTTYSTGAMFTGPVEGIPGIGRAVSHTRLHVLSASGRLLPVGAVGELYIGGAGLARGYLNRAELTALKFVDDPFVPGERLYRTGDMVRWLDDGTLAFLGRADDQVKIRGFRIELGEIETRLSAQPGVAEAVVVAHGEEGGRRLVAYVAAREADADGAALGARLRAALSETLADYMVPGVFVVMDALPLSPNGKIDKRALPEPDMQGAGTFVAPATPTERALAAIWQQLLGCERVSTEANFFHIGGHSLLATRMTAAVAGQLHVRLALRAVFEHPRLDRLAAFIDGSRKDAHETIPLAGREVPLALSPMQQRMHFLHGLAPDVGHYNMPAALRLEGALDVRALRRALDGIVGRHEVLRTVYDDGATGLAQRVLQPHPVALDMHDLSACTDPAAEAARLARCEAARPFDLASGPMLRTSLLRLGPGEHVLLVTLHHIAADGWSVGVIVRELRVLYAAHCAGGTDPLPPLPVQYADYAQWQRSQARGTRMASQLAHLRARLDGLPRVHNLPLDKPRPAQQDFRGQQHVEHVGPAMLARLKALGKANDATLFMVLQGAFALLLGRWSNETDIVMGSPVAGRTHKDTEGLVGLFVNTLVLRTAIAPGEDFGALLRQARATLLDAHANQDLPFEQLVDALQPERSPSHAPLFQVMFSMRDDDAAALRMPGLEVKALPVEHVPAKFDLELTAAESAEGLVLAWNSAASLFDPATIVRMAASFTVLLQAIADAPAMPVGELAMLTAADRDRLRGWNAAGGAAPPAQCIHQLFEEQARRAPATVAVVCEGEALSYGALNARANRIAHRLRAEGVGPDTLVGLCVERSADMVAGMLGILKAGGAYVPLDPAYPRARLEFMVRDSNAPVVLTQARLLDTLPLGGALALCVDRDDDFAGRSEADPDAAAVGVTPAHLAYLIYTSGSTGVPKGVMIEHRNTVALLDWAHAHFSAAELRAVLASTSLNFDLSVFEVFVPLSFGHRCVVVRDALALLEEDCDVSLVNTVPSAMKMLLERGRVPRSAEVINLAGEPLPQKLLNGLFAGTGCRKVWNLYGPSEDTTYSTGAMFTGPVEGIPGIGRAVSHTRLHVLSASGRLLPVGAVGELYIGGAGLARGYLNRAELTALKFVDDPFMPGERLYRTGDMVRWLDDGTLAFLGRADDQVKIRGFRIELGEIETRLSAQPGVAEAVVVAHGEEGGRRLVAYVAAREAGADGAALGARLRAALSETLADYMVPGVFVVMDALPLSPNGKIDKRALPEPDMQETGTFVAPATPTERALAAIWQQLLGCERVSTEANFFHIGGHSLLLTQMIHLAAQRAGLVIGVRQVFANPTIAGLAAALDAGGAGDRLRHEASAGPAPLSAAQQRIWLAGQIQEDAADNNIVGAVRMARRIEPGLTRAAFDVLARRHDILRTVIEVYEDAVRQQVQPEPVCEIAWHDLRGRPHADVALASLLREHGARPFDTGRLPLVSLLVAQDGDDTCVVQVSIHHIIADGWSLVLFFDQLMDAYDVLAAGTGTIAGTGAPQLGYLDYVAWQQRFLASPEARRQEDFWRAYLKGASQQILLPFQSPMPTRDGARGEVIRRRVGASTRAGLRALAGQARGSLFNVMHAALALLLGRVCAEADLNIGIPVSGRHIAGSEGVLGMFLNNLPLRSRIDLRQPFDAFLEAQVANAAEVLSCQDLPFERILALSGTARNPASTPLFQVFLNMLSLPDARDGRRLLNEASDMVGALGSKFNLSLYVSDGDDDGIKLYCSFNEKLLAARDVELLLEQYVYLLDQVAADGARLCGHYLLRAGAAGVQAPPMLAGATLPDPTLPMIETDWIGSVQHNFGQVAARWPARLAMACSGRTWTYGELDRITGVYATRLQALGVRPGDVVGIMTERHDALVIATLAILKAGAAFMMLSQAVPPLRVLQQIEAVPPCCVVTLAQSARLDPVIAGHLDASGCARLEVAADRALLDDGSGPAFETVASGPDDLAYIAFTSGTEGAPKAIRGRHGSLTTFMPWMAARFGLTPDDRFGMLSGLVHDPLHRDMFTPLCMGAALYVPEEADLAFSHLNDWLLEHRITVLHLTPSLGTFLCSVCERPVGTLRIAFFVGEIITTGHVRQFCKAAPNMRVINIYGSTETGRAISYHDVDAYQDAQAYCTDVIPAGIGIRHVQLLVLNDTMTPCGVGELGQIAARSRYMSLGYHEDAALNTAKFVPNPYGGDPADIVYLTGDRGRYRRDGVVECHGRTDRQIKIRGFRVELSEIQVCLILHPAVAQCALSTWRDALGETAIVAYVVAAQDGAATVDSMAAFLAQRLPDYMLPSEYMFLDALPRNENGKLDPKRLPPVVPRPAAAPSAPETALEAQLLSIWQSVFRRESIGVQDDFFKIGGHSLMATQLFVRIEREFGLRMDYKSFFAANSIRAAAARIETARLAAGVRRAGAGRARQITL
ncbi:amino acid adenylation domain-containing protein [Massilia forsythiae]|uniref:Amino acid adenylation domain-containing protein n=1 Tax=Massilia forsythiae TaxID=2728020 RepID=A0A7Z2VXZ6_9BURK|nr:non-ribosomal peptide synthetase [Massilia forsythiae]QJE01523.1 amino acid adenylation domain-containing protein [Massilia forsythiae]